MKNTESGASLSETALIILFVCLFSVGSISSLRDRSEATLWLVTLSLMSPETYLPDGRTRVDVWAPASAFRIYGGIEIPNNWCRVVLFREPEEIWNRPRVRASDIIECADRPA